MEANKTATALQAKSKAATGAKPRDAGGGPTITEESAFGPAPDVVMRGEGQPFRWAPRENCVGPFRGHDERETTGENRERAEALKCRERLPPPKANMGSSLR